MSKYHAVHSMSKQGRLFGTLCKKSWTSLIIDIDGFKNLDEAEQCKHCKKSIEAMGK